MVEAADAWRCSCSPAAPLVLGPHINIYSREALAEHRRSRRLRWWRRWSFARCAGADQPAGQPGARAPARRGHRHRGLAVGRRRWPSARCFTARHHRGQGRLRAFRCIADPDGLLLVLRGPALPGAQRHADAIGHGAEPVRRRRGAACGWRVQRLRLSPCAWASARRWPTERGDESRRCAARRAATGLALACRGCSARIEARALAWSETQLNRLPH